MQIFTVGGAVRDRLLGRTPQDTDYVVVGATPQDMLDRGFTMVGADFPVFLHPQTKDEYALARTERKTGRGYGGFTVHAAPDVTLEDDLARRDLTINAMALTADGRLVDPFGGAQHLRQRVLQHVGPAFAEDPLRVLRIGRFLARLGPEWTLAPATAALVRDMVARGEVDALTRERVWQELERGLQESYPQRMLDFFTDLDLWARPGFADYRSAPQGDTAGLARAVAAAAPLAVRFALAFPAQAEHWFTPNSVVPALLREVAVHCERYADAIVTFPQLPPSGQMALLEALDLRRRSQRANAVLQAVEHQSLRSADPVRRAAQALADLDQRAIIGTATTAVEIAARLRAARLQTLAAL